MRLLFFPSDLGGGFGHISRCLALAQEAKEQGHNCAFVFNDTKYQREIGSQYDIFISRIHSSLSSFFSLLKARIAFSRSQPPPLFTEISGLDYQVIRDGLVGERILERKIDEYHQIVNTYNPDVLVGDTNLLVWIVGQKSGLPVVQIVRYASHPRTAQLIWWKNLTKGLIPPDSSALFNPLLLKMGLRPIKSAGDLLQGDLYIVPSIPEIEPIPKDEKTFHVGALTISTKNSDTPSWLSAIGNNFPLVYITIGGGARTVGTGLFFSTVIEAFADESVQVVVSTSSKFDSLNFSNVPKNISFFKWVPGKLLISKADLVIFHGGYGTMMESIACGTPTITIPFHTEQEGNGRRLEQAGCGLVLKLSCDRYEPVKASWKYGHYSFLIQNNYDLTSGELRTQVGKVLLNEAYEANTRNLQSKVKDYRGTERTMDLIEKYCR